MGISKLVKYIDTNYDWRDVPLKDCPVVLDGNGLPYYLSRRADLKWKFGGQYPALRQVMEDFLDALRQRNVKPICIVFDGIDPADKLETLRVRKEGFQKTVIDGINGQESYGHQNILPPLITETFRKFLEDYNSSHGNLKIYSGDEEADSLGIVIANNLNCPLLGEDSDYFISALKNGYIPYSKISWSGAGSPVTGKAYYRDSFARSLGIEPEVVLAIPALVGNDSLPNLVDTTSLKRIRDNPDYRGADTETAILFIKRQRSLSAIERNIESNDGTFVLDKFREGMQKAREMYEGSGVFDEVYFRKFCSYRPKNGGHFPTWMIEQYRDFKLSKNFFEVLLKAVYFHRVIPDDYTQESAKIFSRPIRLLFYGILQVREVREVVRVGQGLVVQQVTSQPSELSIFTMDTVPVDRKIQELCRVSMCNVASLSSLKPEWYIPIASVCYWAKTARVSKNDLKLKALLLCFAECFKGDKTTFNPRFDVSILHSLTQWQCAYHDCINLNQILGLPLPYLSPAYLFDGKRVSHYCSQGERYLEDMLAQATPNIHSLYVLLLSAVQQNL